MVHVTPMPEDLHARAMRLRLVRAGLLKIMRETNIRATEKDADALMKNFVVDNADAVR